jgi:hypothetical protein
MNVETTAGDFVAAAPSMSSIEAATTVMTAATIALTAIALIAIVGLTLLRRSVVRIAEKRVEKYLQADMGVYLEGPEFRGILKSLVDEAQANYIRNRVESAPEGGGAAAGGGPREITK